MKFIPLGARVLAERIEESLSDIIIIPDNAKEKPVKAKIVAKGPGKFIGNHLVPVDVEIGDTILFEKFFGIDVKVDDKMYVLVREEEIIAVL